MRIRQNPKLISLIKELLIWLEDDTPKILRGKVILTPIKTVMVPLFEGGKRETALLSEGQIVFTNRGVGVIVPPKWTTSITNLSGKFYVMLRGKKSRRDCIHHSKLYKLSVIGSDGVTYPISTAFYDHLSLSVGDYINFTVSTSKAAIITKEEQENHKADYQASKKGFYEIAKKLKEDGMWNINQIK